MSPWAVLVNPNPRLDSHSTATLGQDADAKINVSVQAFKLASAWALQDVLPMAVLATEAGRPSLCDPHRACIDSKLDAGLSAQRIYQDLVSELSFSGSYQSVKRFLRQSGWALLFKFWF